MGNIEKIIIKYDLDDADYPDWEIRANQLPRYRLGISPMDAQAKRLGELLAQYKKIFEGFISAHVEALKLENQKQQAIAKDLWNQA